MRGASTPAATASTMRDTAAAANGVASTRSYTERAERCHTDKRGASEICNAMVDDHLIAKQRLRCFVPLDPDEDRRTVVAEVADLTASPLWAVALVAFQDVRRQPLPDLPAMFPSAETIRSRLKALGYWG